MRTGLNAKASGDTGRVMVVLLTDGRANVSLAKSNEDPEALAEGAPKLSKVGPLMTPCFGQDCLQITPVVWYVPGQAMQCNHKGACETPVTNLITMQHCCPKERRCLQVWSIWLAAQQSLAISRQCMSCSCKAKLADWPEQHAVDVE